MRRALMLGFCAVVFQPLWAQNVPATAQTQPAITTQNLSAATRDAIGLLPAEATGIPRDFWGTSSALRATTLLNRINANGVPASRRLLHRILLAETVPPRAANDRASFLLARIDKLISIGAVDEAEALITRAGRPDAALFRRLFDIALLTGRAERACGLLALDPRLSPGRGADVFCAVRARDEATATAKMIAGINSGQIPPQQAQHLKLLMNPESFDENTILDTPDPYTPLDHILREATGQPRQRNDLPPAFLYADLERRMPLRDRILSAERLTRVGDFPYPLLFNLYRLRAPAASGGVWARMAAVQALDAAILGGDPDSIKAAIAEADTELSAMGLRISFAEAYAETFAKLPVTASPDGRLSELLLLSAQPQQAAQWAPDTPSTKLRLAFQIASKDTEIIVSMPQQQQGQSIERLRAEAALTALSGFTPRSAERDTLRDMIRTNRRGEAILNALRILDAGVEIEPGDFGIALDILIRSDRREDAQSIALQTLLFKP